MIVTISIGGEARQIDTENAIDISIPLDFYGPQANAFGVEKASSKPCEAGSLVGDTRRGGSCNFEQITLIPHCNGTHTECVGHITNERISVIDCLTDAFSLAQLITIESEAAGSSNETYVVNPQEDDLLITRKLLERAIGIEIRTPSLIIRTTPNPPEKMSATYLEAVPPFFSTEAMEYLNEIGVKHLLVDLPSIDRIYDDGKLSNHRIFWNLEPGKFEIRGEDFKYKTVTELIYVPEEVEDGFYLLNLQIAPFVADAAPSRPLLFRS